MPLPTMGQFEILPSGHDRALDALDALQEARGRAEKLLERIDQFTIATAFGGELVSAVKLVSSDAIPSPI
jgi:hypothetical protein